MVDPLLTVLCQPLLSSAQPGVTNHDQVLIHVHEIMSPSVPNLTVQLNWPPEMDDDGLVVIYDQPVDTSRKFIDV